MPVGIYRLLVGLFLWIAPFRQFSFATYWSRTGHQLVDVKNLPRSGDSVCKRITVLWFFTGFPKRRFSERGSVFRLRWCLKNIAKMKIYVRFTPGPAFAPTPRLPAA